MKPNRMQINAYIKTVMLIANAYGFVITPLQLQHLVAVYCQNGISEDVK